MSEGQNISVKQLAVNIRFVLRGIKTGSLTREETKVLDIGKCLDMVDLHYHGGEEITEDFNEEDLYMFIIYSHELMEKFKIEIPSYSRHPGEKINLLNIAMEKLLDIIKDMALKSEEDKDMALKSEEDFVPLDMSDLSVRRFISSSIRLMSAYLDMLSQKPKNKHNRDTITGELIM